MGEARTAYYYTTTSYDPWDRSEPPQLLASWYDTVTQKIRRELASRERERERERALEPTEHFKLIFLAIQ